MILEAWNIRGLNSPIKKNETKVFLSKNKITIMGIIETKVKAKNASTVSKGILCD